MSSIVQIQLRRDTSLNWSSNNPVLAQGEPAFETDTRRIKIGDGVASYNSLPYFDGDKNFVFTQALASSTWDISHNLDKIPSVTIFDSTGTPLVGQVNNIDNNNLQISFNKPISGKAYLN